jgi:GMP synthase-like glutamine amidotransferase
MEDRSRLLVVEHEPDAPAGLFADWADSRGFTVATVCPGAGGKFPVDLTAFRGVVVLGSELAAYDDSIPWLGGELALVARAVAESVPLLGICFGGQVLARTLGARVYRLPQPEIGWIKIDSQSPQISSGPWPTWHRDAFDLPAGARELAGGDASLQAFSIGPHVGVQFHPEATPQILQAWLAVSNPPLDPGLAARIEEGSAAFGAAAADSANGLFSAWLDGDLGDAAR